MKIIKLITLLLFFCTALQGFSQKSRIIISTDAGGSDPDDYQSLVHYLVYSDLFDTEALVSSPPKGGRKSDILNTLAAYEKDYSNLSKFGNYPTPSYLKSITVQGALNPSPPGAGKSTEGSQRIISAAKKSDSRPLYILVWGSITDVAQALYDDPSIKSKIRVYSIGAWNTSQDPSSRNYIYNSHTDLWWIENNTTFRGMYVGGNQSGDLGNTGFVSQHVKGHGALGDYFYAQKKDIKMGDTPSFLYMLSPLVGGVGNLSSPTSESWGGQFVKTGHGPNFWTDRSDESSGGYNGAATVNKWRENYLRDWQVRMDRLTTPTPEPTKGLIPGKIEAENYAAMSGVEKQNTSDTGAGQNVGYISTGDWMDYEVNVQSAGTYNVSYRVASPNSGKQFELRKGNSTLHTVTVPNTGGYQNWVTTTATATLTAGQQTLRIYALSGGWNFNWFEGQLQVTSPTLSATASSSENSTNTPGKTLDNNLLTRWAAQGIGQWIQYDLGASQSIDGVEIAWYQGNERTYNFEILLSTNGSSWASALTTSSNGTTSTLQTFSFNTAIARYIRIVCNGSNVSDWNSISEFKIRLANATMRVGNMEDQASSRQNAIAVYPNPTTSVLNVDIPSTEGSQVELSVFNHSGLVMRHQYSVEVGANSISLPINLQAGSYVLEIKTKASKVIEQRHFLVR